MTTDAFKISDLSKFYGPTMALDKVTIAAPKRAVGLLGPNGAGKTTLIRILMGIIRHSSGSGTVLGYDFCDSIQEIRDHVGYSPEFTPMIPDVSAMKYVTFMGKLSGLASVEAAQRAHDTLHYVGLAEERYRPLREFSTGMMQKCKLAAALVHDPDLVILDEPTDGLDPTGRQQMLELIERLYKDEGKSLIVSSHLLFDVERVCDWVMVLGRGQLVTSGEMSSLLADTSGMLRVRITGDVLSFSRKLTAKGLEVEVDSPFLDVKRDNGTEMAILEEVNRDPNVSLRYLGSRTRTLEDVFISIVEGRELG
ncbi:MAG: ATP-binding cassette domain-containing protein [Candidatus Thorarchaeota archaeon]|jgi:ABC-2 type transport system ATP-binding protein